MNRVKDNRDFEREARASKRYEELRRLDAYELRTEALLHGIDPLHLSRQQVIAAIIENEEAR